MLEGTKSDCSFDHEINVIDIIDISKLGQTKPWYILSLLTTVLHVTTLYICFSKLVLCPIIALCLLNPSIIIIFILYNTDFNMNILN